MQKRAKNEFVRKRNKNHQKRRLQLTFLLVLASGGHGAVAVPEHVGSDEFVHLELNGLSRKSNKEEKSKNRNQTTGR